MKVTNEGWLPPRAERPHDYIPPERRGGRAGSRFSVAGFIIILVALGASAFALTRGVTLIQAFWKDGQNYQPPAPTPMQAARRDNLVAKAFAEDQVRKILKDPDSARFGVEVVRNAKAPLVCGEVNARNSFDGMTGNRPFIVIGTLAEIDEYPHEASFRKIWNRLCAGDRG